MTLPGVLTNDVFHTEFDLVFCQDLSVNSGGCLNGMVVCVQLLEKRSSEYAKVYQGDLAKCGAGDEFLGFVVKLPYNSYTFSKSDNYKFVADSTHMAYMRRLGEKNSIFNPVYVPLGDTAFENHNCIEIKVTAEKPKKDYLYSLGGKQLAKFPHEDFVKPVSDNFQRGGVFNITVLGTEDCGMTLKIRGQDTLTCHPVNVTVCESGKVATEAVQKICALDMGNSRIQHIGEDGNVMPDVMPHTMIVEGIRHEAERVLFGNLRQLVLSNFNAPAKRYEVAILAFEGEEINAAHLILECNAGTGLKYKYSSGVIVNFKSGVYAGSYYL
ncbi:hypothetical protein DdX_12941 [Ditylenchus destructor]|uniref:Uncharacterized protein n=1 Tax=Ditylenchus destructor TaxID=166010 RepID=A0AAD4R2Z8_9BILA|nr:hypothetical protein DdX_12941 [Ditylenchus destructor]